MGWDGVTELNEVRGQGRGSWSGPLTLFFALSRRRPLNLHPPSFYLQHPPHPPTNHRLHFLASLAPSQLHRALNNMVSISGPAAPPRFPAAGLLLLLSLTLTAAFLPPPALLPPQASTPATCERPSGAPKRSF